MKINTLFTPVEVTTDTLEGQVEPGTIVTLDTNLPADIIFTLDGQSPKDGEFGTIREAAPVEIEIKTTTTIKYKAIDDLRSSNQSRAKQAVYTVNRTRQPLEDFKKTKFFFRKLDTVIIDHNFYLGGDWLVPVSTKPSTYVFVNRESSKVKVRLLHNGIDVLGKNSFPVLEEKDAFEFTLRPTQGDNIIEIQTEEII